MEEVTEQTASSDANMEATLIEKATATAVRAAIQELAIEYREVIVLRELEGWSYKEIAKIVGVPLGTVMSRLSRGRRDLQSKLSRILEKR